MLRWKEPVYGECAVCGVKDRLIRHHVVLAQHVLVLRPGDEWNLDNSLLIGSGQRCGCHRDHHSACPRIPRSVLTPEAIAFAVDLMGRDRAELYLARYYRA